MRDSQRVKVVTLSTTLATKDLTNRDINNRVYTYSMILPKEIKSRHKIRDFNIIKDFIDSGLNQTLIAEKYKVTQGRVSQIIKTNATAIISTTKDYDKVKRLAFMNRALLNNNLMPDAKTKLELVEAKRKEYEGDQSVTVQNSFLVIEKNPAIQNRLDEISTNR